MRKIRDIKNHFLNNDKNNTYDYKLPFIIIYFITVYEREKVEKINLILELLCGPYLQAMQAPVCSSLV